MPRDIQEPSQESPSAAARSEALKAVMTQTMEQVMPPMARLHLDQAERVASLAHDTACLALRPPQPTQFGEAAQLSAATLQRLLAMQSGWAESWAKWAEYASALPQADTIPKYMERAGNIILQAQAQITAQVNDLTELSENLSVSYSYWVARQVTPPRPK